MMVLYGGGISPTNLMCLSFSATSRIFFFLVLVDLKTSCAPNLSSLRPCLVHLVWREFRVCALQLLLFCFVWNLHLQEVKVEYMEWYRVDRVNDVVVPKDRSQWSRFQLQNRWKQWGENEVTSKLGDGNTSDEAYEAEMNHLVCQTDQTEISCVQVEEGLSAESSLYWTTLLDNQVYQPNRLPGSNQTDENFMNYLHVDDVLGNEHFHFHGSPRFHGRTSDMLLDSSSDLYNMDDMSSYENMNAEDFFYSLDWEKNQSDTPHYDLSGMIPNAIPQYSTRVGDQPSLEETVLQEFGSAMQKMTDESRLCFRDALYRLASNSKKQGQLGDHLPSEKPFITVLPNQTLRSTESEACKSRTNAIDRTVADFLFNKSYLNDNSHQELVSTAKPNSSKRLKNALAPHFQHFIGPTPEDAVVPTIGQGEPQYSEY